jgi:hypothetical protein
MHCFTSIASIAHWTQARHPTVACAIQWVFDEAQPRYLELRPGEPPQVATGRHACPRLTLRCRAADWMRSPPANSGNSALSSRAACVPLVI